MFPAPAGINRSAFAQQPWLSRVPRASGDKPAYGANPFQLLPCSPRQRG